MMRLAAVLCAAALFLSPAGAAPRPSHPAPRVAPGPGGPPSTVLMEVATGQVLQSADPHRRLPPASLDKLMTLYLTLAAIRAGRLTLDTPVTVSATAWRVGRTLGSSRMFLNAGDTVSARDLLEGLMIASGNDAAQALAEAVAGSGERFVEEMNAAAQRLGLQDTRFVTPHGLPEPGEYTSAWDMTLLARRILLDDPRATELSSPRYMTYAGIRQANWNNLVFRDPRMDGLKTGHTTESGFSIVATAREGEMRLIASVLGAPTLRRRTELAEGLFSLGFSRFALVTVPWETIVPATLTVYGGRAGTLPLAAASPVAVLLPRDARGPIEVSEQIAAPWAPVRAGQEMGRLTVRREGAAAVTVPLVAKVAVDRGGLLVRAWDSLRFAAGGLLRRNGGTFHGTYTPAAPKTSQR